ncbi:hypothetical protein [Geofilum rhodophaeum]|uniref:hypothetical protein n=1 Tax=Geofilum rhodophaeum TaxID=1965019 RepID=UPI000B527B81|nr:hypothetical protein [Geofilum rhodophaeum]
MDKKSLRSLQIIYWAIFVGLAGFAIVAVGLGPEFASGGVLDAGQIELLKSVIILLALAGIPSGFVFHNRKVRRIPHEWSWPEKMRVYRNSFLFKVAVLDSLGFLALIGFLLSANTAFLYIWALILVAFLLNVPTYSKVLLELDPMSAYETVPDDGSADENMDEDIQEKK